MSEEKSDHLSVFQFFEDFPDEQSAIDFLEAERWPDGVVCPRCHGSETKRVAKRNRHNCRDCRRLFSVRTGTVMEKTRMPLRKWLYAMYLMQTARKGVSSIQLSKELGIRQSSAWFMLHRLREAMVPEMTRLEGVIEIDEAYVGGLEKNKHAKDKLHENWMQGKQLVLGMRQRGGPILMWPVSSGHRRIIEDDILMYVAEGSTVYTDEGTAFFNLGNWYEHEFVQHKRGVYVDGEVTTNGIESVWAVLKRAHKGVYHQWSKKHGHRYFSEVAFRLVEGSVKLPVMVRVKNLARRTWNVRLTYNELTHE